jgi:hypothetical protein
VKAQVAVAVVITLAGVMAITQAVVDGLADPPPQAPPPGLSCAPYEPGLQHDAKISFAAVGDVLTDWQAPEGSSPTSWVAYAGTAPVRFAGGYAQAGLDAAVLAGRVQPVNADVLVILTGVTDLRFGSANDSIELGLQRIASRVGAEHVLLSSIPPVRGQIEATVQFNDWLARVAYRHGWSFVDAGGAVRTPDCKYRPGLSIHGLRPNAEGARLIGEAIRSALTGRPEFLRPAPS